MIVPQTPGRWMLFIDGENLTIRAQEFLKAESVPVPESQNYKRDCFIWPGKNLTALGYPAHLETRPIRCFYYTSAVGDEMAIQGIQEQLWSLGFEPHVFKKARQDQKTKGVDIALTKDMLSHAFRGNYDAAMLVAGDGDYVPLVEEVKRLGKQVIVIFFERWTKPKLRLAADQFVDVAERILVWAQTQRPGV